MVRPLRPYILGFLIVFLGFAVLLVLGKIDFALRDAMIVLLGGFALRCCGAEWIFAYRHDDAQHVSRKVLTRKEKPFAFWANVSVGALAFAITVYAVAHAAIRLAIGIDINGPIARL